MCVVDKREGVEFFCFKKLQDRYSTLQYINSNDACVI